GQGDPALLQWVFRPEGAEELGPFRVLGQKSCQAILPFNRYLFTSVGGDSQMVVRQNREKAPVVEGEQFVPHEPAIKVNPPEDHLLFVALGCKDDKGATVLANSVELSLRAAHRPRPRIHDSAATPYPPVVVSGRRVLLTTRPVLNPRRE